MGMRSVPLVLWCVTYQFTLSSQPLSSHPLDRTLLRIKDCAIFTFVVVLSVCHTASHTADTPYSPLFHTFVGLLEFTDICGMNE